MIASAPLPEWVGMWAAIALLWVAARGLVRDWLFDRRRKDDE